MPFDSSPNLLPPPARIEDVTLDELIAWLETKNPAEQYNIGSPSRCLWGQFSAAHGLPIAVSADEMPGGGTFDSWGWRVAMDGRSTFGSALKRARSWRRFPDLRHFLAFFGA